MGLDSHYGNPDVKEKGKWFPLKDDDAELLIRHASNEDYVQYLIDNLSPGAREFLTSVSEQAGAIETNEMPDIDDDLAEETNEVLRNGAAEHILVDWKNIKLDDPELADEFNKEPGENIGYSTERVKTMFELIPGFYDEVRDIAQQQAAFTKETEEADIKN